MDCYVISLCQRGNTWAMRGYEKKMIISKMDMFTIRSEEKDFVYGLLSIHCSLHLFTCFITKMLLTWNLIACSIMTCHLGFFVWCLDVGLWTRQERSKIRASIDQNWSVKYMALLLFILWFGGTESIKGSPSIWFTLPVVLWLPINLYIIVWCFDVMIWYSLHLSAWSSFELGISLPRTLVSRGWGMAAGTNNVGYW